MTDYNGIVADGTDDAAKRLLDLAGRVDLAAGFAAEQKEIGALIGSPNQGSRSAGSRPANTLIRRRRDASNQASSSAPVSGR